MPKQKDLKRIVRSRMQKTGESYTAARLQLIRKKEEPALNYATAGMSDASVKKQTGRDWPEWVRVLDAAKSSEKPHREIAQYVSSLGTPDWWSQMVTVGYERIRGLRDRGQRRGGGYETTKSRTFAVPVSKLFDAFAKPRLRARWLPGKITIRTATPQKTMRMNMEDGTLVAIGFTSKGDRKSAVAIQHGKFPDKSTADKIKAWWAERFDALSEILG
ncbi:MAG: SRPBCC family protein [Thermoanaerobaculia bacterium]